MFQNGTRVLRIINYNFWFSLNVFDTFFLIVVGYILTFIEEIIANDENYLFQSRYFLLLPISIKRI